MNIQGGFDMKRLLCLVLVLMLTLSLASFASAEAADPSLAEYLEGKTIVMRMLRCDDEVRDSLKLYFDDFFGVTMGDFQLSDSGIDSLLLQLQTGKIDGLLTWSFEANYFDAMNDDMKALYTAYPTYIYASMAVSADIDNAEDVYNLLNDTIIEMKEDGTLAALEDKYVTNLTEETQTEKIEMPYTDGAPTYRVVVTGWAVPLDYFDGEGNPMGFDAAMLAEIARRKGINFEIVSYEPSSGMLAVGTGKADINFCYTMVMDDDTEFDMEEDRYVQGLNGASMYATTPYFSSTELMLLVKE